MDKAYTKEELGVLEKSLKDLGFSQEKIDEAITKAKGDTEDIEKSKNNIDDEGLEKAKELPTEESKVEKDDLKKSMDDVAKSIGEYHKAVDVVNKAIAVFQDLSGKLPGADAPTSTDLGKSIDTDIDKSVEENKEPENGEKSEESKKPEEGAEPKDKSTDASIEKSFGGEDFMKSFGTMLDERLDAKNATIEKSISEINEKYDKIEKSMEQFMDSPASKQKAITHNYNPIEKSIKTDDKGRRIVSTSNKQATLRELETAFDKATGDDKVIIGRAIPNYEISKSIDNDAFGIVKSINDIEFEA